MGCPTSAAMGVCLCVQASCRAVASVQEATAAPGTRDMSSSLTLDNIRSTLIRQEDSIIFNFIERAQFAANPVVYQAGGVQVPGTSKQCGDVTCKAASQGGTVLC